MKLGTLALRRPDQGTKRVFGNVGQTRSLLGSADENRSSKGRASIPSKNAARPDVCVIRRVESGLNGRQFGVCLVRALTANATWSGTGRLACLLVGGAIALAAIGAVQAQTVAPAVTQAQDAFGQRVGDEIIGLYNESQVRGFSLENAGNYLLDGHYFVRSGRLPDGLVEQSTVKVGVSALQSPFPAPSGLVEFALRKPGAGPAGIEATAGLRWAGSDYYRVNVWASNSEIAADGASIVGGIEIVPEATFPDGTEGNEYNFGMISEARLNNVSIRALVGGSSVQYNGDYGFISTHGVLPAPVPGRYEMFGPQWGEFKRTERIAGVTARWLPRQDLEAEAAFFHSKSDTPKADFTSLELTAPGRALATVSMARDQEQSVNSAEVKIA